MQPSVIESIHEDQEIGSAYWSARTSVCIYTIRGKLHDRGGQVTCLGNNVYGVCLWSALVIVLCGFKHCLHLLVNRSAFLLYSPPYVYIYIYIYWASHLGNDNMSFNINTELAAVIKWSFSYRRHTWVVHGGGPRFHSLAVLVRGTTFLGLNVWISTLSHAYFVILPPLFTKPLLIRQPSLHCLLQCDLN